jgi:hypothetical protein
MTRVADFVLIQGDAEVFIGDAVQTYWEKGFITDGRLDDRAALLTFMVKQLTLATDPMIVKINGVEVGSIYPYPYPSGAGSPNLDSHWYTALVHVAGEKLNDAPNTNTLRLEAAPLAGGTVDDIYVRDVFCFYHKDV